MSLPREEELEASLVLEQASTDEHHLEEFAFQVAGHTAEKMWRLGSDVVLKPMMKPELFRREVQFYEEVTRQNLPLLKCLPAFHGVVQLTGHSFMALQDLTRGFRQPSLIDIKMGRQTFEPSASEDKKARELSKFPHQHSLGFRITGMKVWNESMSRYCMYDKHFGRTLGLDQMAAGLGTFFFNGRHLRCKVMESCLDELLYIQSILSQHSAHTFYSSSLLLVYDSEGDGCTVKMIDFAHASPPSSPADPNEGYLHGLGTLIQLVRELIDCAKADASALECRIQGLQARWTQ